MAGTDFDDHDAASPQETRADLEERGPMGLAWQRLAQDHVAVVTMALIGVYMLLAILAPVLPVQSFSAQDRSALLQAPSAQYWFGTDHLGRDVFARIVFGIRTSFWVVTLAVVLAAVGGVITGITAGYLGGWVDTFIMRSFDSLLAFPVLLLAIAVTALLGPSAFNASIALAIIGVPRFARLTRGDVLRERQREYIEAARCIGLGPVTIMRRHLLPNIMGTILVQATLFVAFAILVEAALSFLGLGTQVPRPSLGLMLVEGRPYFRDAWWFAVMPGGALAILVLAINIFSERLRDALDSQANR